MDNFKKWYDNITTSIDELTQMLEGIEENPDYSKIISIFNRIHDQTVSSELFHVRADLVKVYDLLFTTIHENNDFRLYFKTYLSEYLISLDTAERDNLYYFVAYKSFIVQTIYWKIHDETYDDINALKYDLDAIKFCLDDAGKASLYNLLESNYKIESFKNFEDYSNCIVDMMTVSYITGRKITNSEFEKLVLSVSYAGGESGNRGYDYRGIQTIESVFGLVDESDFVQEVLTKLNLNDNYNIEIKVTQAISVIEAASLSQDKKNEIKLICINTPIFDNAFKRAIYSVTSEEKGVEIYEDSKKIVNSEYYIVATTSDEEFMFSISSYDSGSCSRGGHI